MYWRLECNNSRDKYVKLCVLVTSKDRGREKESGTNTEWCAKRRWAC